MSGETLVRCERSMAHIRVAVQGEVIAETRDALLVHEAGHAPAWYIPAADVRRDLLQRTDHQTRCPRKGVATYWTISTAGETLENAAWSYETPIAQAEALKGYLSFYTHLVDVQAEGTEHAG